jgi:hypothetical protein
MNRDWMARATAEVELGLKLSKKLTDAHSVPDAVAAYQEWLNEEMGARAEDARLLLSNGQKNRRRCGVVRDRVRRRSAPPVATPSS